MSLTALALGAGACGGDDGKGGKGGDESDGGPGPGDGNDNDAGRGSIDAGTRMDGAVITPTTDAGDGGNEIVLEDGAIVTPPPPPSGTDAGDMVDTTPLPHDGARGSICYGKADCKGDDIVCYAPNGQLPGTCVDNCQQDSDCPSPQTCYAGYCRNDCAGMDMQGSGACPDHQVCKNVSNAPLFPLFSCVYPYGSGSRAVDEYGACSVLHGNGDCEGLNVCHAPYDALTLPTPIPTVTGYCAGTCQMASDCAVPAGTTATSVCDFGVCGFDCGGAGKNNCPDPKMNCRDIDPSLLTAVYRCVYIDG